MEVADTLLDRQCWAKLDMFLTVIRGAQFARDCTQRQSLKPCRLHSCVGSHACSHYRCRQRAIACRRARHARQALVKRVLSHLPRRIHAPCAKRMDSCLTPASKSSPLQPHSSRASFLRSAKTSFKTPTSTTSTKPMLLHWMAALASLALRSHVIRHGFGAPLPQLALSWPTLLFGFCQSCAVWATPSASGRCSRAFTPSRATA
ncbi:hypothetical protein BCR44DRAFT_358188 [Catenaria anguillulae PL171]|uniref:Uncharacterized protein n=1 Tax=Catenaria anguillulae PL171 TaxID=765915 RepID=A0A1Y2H7S0_9FUNG|nr:hypothetical protein BCR44DRAFT_358188 [Catenaria anguillulae PL171]